MNITMKQFFEMVTKTIAEPNTTITDSYPAILARSLGGIMNDNPTHEEMIEEAARRERSNRVLQRYNDFHNLETSGLSWGTPVTMEQQQMIAFQSMIDALRCEYLNQEYTHIAITDIEDLIEALYQQSISFLERVKEFKDSADGVA